MSNIDVKETILPGIGVRHDFVSKQGRALGVIYHRSGESELLIYDRDDPDACFLSIFLEEEEAHTLAELLGGSRITEELMEVRQTKR